MTSFVVLLAILGFIYCFVNREKSENLVDNSKLIEFKYIKSQYMKSEKWYKKRRKVLIRDNFSCIKCGTSINLHVHHLRDYSKIPNEPISSLVTLCDTCHESEHILHGYPKTYQDYIEWNVPKPIPHNINLKGLRYVKPKSNRTSSS